VSAAARSVHISQPAVTQAIAGLERFFGAPLLLRRSTGVSLTSAGAICLARIERSMSQLREAVGATTRNAGAERADVERLVRSRQLDALGAKRRLLAEALRYPTSTQGASRTRSTLAGQLRPSASTVPLAAWNALGRCQGPMQTARSQHRSAEPALMAACSPGRLCSRLPPCSTMRAAVGSAGVW